MKLALAFALGALAGPLCALPQNDVCEGNGIGNVYITHDTARLGRPVTIRVGSPDHPRGIAILGVSDSTATTFQPQAGFVCLDLNSPVYAIYVVQLDANGDGSIRFDAPLDPSTLGAGYAPDRATRTALLPSFAHAATVEGAALGVSKTVRITWELPQAYRRVGDLQTARSAHTATALGQDPRDNRTRVFVAGGGGGTLLAPTATRSTELYDTLTRSFVPGPDMAQERSYHTATLLQDGRVLLAGGVDSGGVAQTSCEVFDPSTGLISATGSLGSPRLGHSAIPLPDGRVIATGGVSDFVDAQNRFAAVLDSAQRTTEIWDPATGLWTPYRDMTIRRSGHVVTRMADGRFLITGGFRQSGLATAGFVVPIYNRGAEIFDPATGLFVVTGQMVLSRGFHAATTLSDGRVIVVGGMQSQIGPFSDVHQSISSAEIFDGATWAQLPILFGQAFPAFHQILPTADGRARLVGGLGGLATSLTAIAFGGTYYDLGYDTRGNPLGVSPIVPTSRPSPRGLHTLTRLYDGSYLVAGGVAAGQPLASAFLYVE